MKKHSLIEPYGSAGLAGLECFSVLFKISIIVMATILVAAISAGSIAATPIISAILITLISIFVSFRLIYKYRGVKFYNMLCRTGFIDEEQLKLSNVLFKMRKKTFNQYYMYKVFKFKNFEWFWKSLGVQDDIHEYLLRDGNDIYYWSGEYNRYMYNFRKFHDFMLKNETLMYVIVTYNERNSSLFKNAFKDKSLDDVEAINTFLNKVHEFNNTICDNTYQNDKDIVNHLLSISNSEYKKYLQDKEVKAVKENSIEVKSKDQYYVDKIGEDLVQIKVQQPVEEVKPTPEPEIVIENISNKYL